MVQALSSKVFPINLVKVTNLSKIKKDWFNFRFSHNYTNFV
ncbi:hypothetical protein RV00_GL001803 [Enterococcus devriesei]|uniref:Uncharacterized protein n=1 Tax=Enterococcus devriesei TaxID=319970 RepID=A0A1L8SX59_9ENTE|nr:hypothetical protein RV00_GL001803 [Enterococcus devriesei]